MNRDAAETHVGDAVSLGMDRFPGQCACRRASNGGFGRRTAPGVDVTILPASLPCHGQNDDKRGRIGRYLQVEIDGRVNEQRDDGH